MIRFRPQPWLTLFAILSVGLLVWLGQWQLARLDWKLGLISAVEERTSLPPLPVDRALAEAPALEALRYRPASATGRFDHGRELYVFHHAGGEVGYLIFTPLLRSGGPPLWVNRGFVPQGLRDAVLRPEGEVEGEVTVSGLLRVPVESNAFVPDPDPAERVWYDRDIAQMSDFAGLERTLPVYLEADATPVPGGWPRGGTTRIEFRNNHLSYALTWFSLAAVLIAVYFVFHTSTGRLSFGRNPEERAAG